MSGSGGDGGKPKAGGNGSGAASAAAGAEALEDPNAPTPWSQTDVKRLSFGLIQTPIGLIPRDGANGKSAAFYKRNFWRDISKIVPGKTPEQCRAKHYKLCPGATYLSRGASAPLLRQGVQPSAWRRRNSALEHKSVEEPIALRTVSAFSYNHRKLEWEPPHVSCIVGRQMCQARMMDSEDHIARDHKFMENRAERIKKTTKEIRLKHELPLRKMRQDERDVCKERKDAQWALDATGKTGPVPTAARLVFAGGKGKELPGYFTDYDPSGVRNAKTWSKTPTEWTKARQVEMPFWGAGQGRNGSNPDYAPAPPGEGDPFLGDRGPGVVGRGGFTRPAAHGATGPRVPWETRLHGVAEVGSVNDPNRLPNPNQEGTSVEQEAG